MVYLIKINDIFSIAKVKGFIPSNVVGEVPSNIDPQDYPYLKSRDAIDDTGTPYQEIYLDDDAKTTGLAIQQTANLQAKWDSLRDRRNTKLTTCDYVMISDAPVSDSKRAEWAVYRQSLRDLPSNTADINAIQWPSEPS